MTVTPRAPSADVLDPVLVARLGPVRAIEALTADGRTALVLLQEGDRIGEVWLDRGRLLCSEEVEAAAGILAELLAWPGPVTTVVPGARRPGPCVALPAGLVLRRAKEIDAERRALLRPLDDVAALRTAAPLAVPREGDAFERSILEHVAHAPRSPFELVALGAPREASAAALLRLIDRGALVRVEGASPEKARGSSAAETQPQPATIGGGIVRLFRWMKSQAGDEREAIPAEARPSPVPALGEARRSSPGWHWTEPGVRVHPALPEAVAPTEAWGVLAWDRDRCAVAATPLEITERLLTVLPLERSLADAPTAAFVLAMESAVMTGLERLDPFPPAATEVRRVLGEGATAIEVARVVETHDALARAVMRAGSTAAFGRPASSIEQATVRLGLGKVFRLASARALDLPCFGHTPRRHHGARSACLVAGELAAELVLPEERESAFLAGLLHGLGKLFLVSLAAREARGADPTRVDALVSSYQTSFGVLIAARWGLDTVVSDAVATFPDALAPGGEPPRSLARAVRIAQIVAAGLSEDPPVPEWRIARALRGASDQGLAVGPLFAEARALFADLHR